MSLDQALIVEEQKGRKEEKKKNTGRVLEFRENTAASTVLPFNFALLN